MNITKAIIPVAGWGTRRLPVAKAVEKCMIPLLNRPIIDYAIEDCVKAGVTDVYFVVSGDALQLRNYYEPQPMLEDYLRQKGKEELIEKIRPPQGVTFHYISQDLSDGRYGTSIPAWLCRDYVNQDESVLIIMGDQTLYRTDGGSEMVDLINLVEQSGAAGGLIGVPVPREQIGMYGIIEADENGNYRRIIEHPMPEETTSNLNNASIYVMGGTFFDYLDNQIENKRISEGEYLIIDAVNDFVAAGNTMSVLEAKGKYLDCGSLDNWVSSNTWLLEHVSE